MAISCPAPDIVRRDTIAYPRIRQISWSMFRGELKYRIDRRMYSKKNIDLAYKKWE
ncbi:hypothetical protein SAMN05216311_105351 [Chitinophaga sp. CF418]|nr:hypothetical protein SAMN05216311_105351 [Chitinophaga sp. CF418]